MTRPQSPRRKTILCHVGARAIAARTRRGLARLGYALVDAEDFYDEAGPALRLADERRLAELPTLEDDPDTPIVILTGARTDFAFDPRVSGLLYKPVGLGELYGVFQDSLELHPRRSPRVPTELPARGIRLDRVEVGAITSLSEYGCLFRTAAPMPRDHTIELQFALPGQGLVRTGAQPIHHGNSASGLVFSDPPGSLRQRIATFVSSQLTR